MFVDRDGVLVADVGPVSRWEDIRVCASAPEAIRRLHAAGFLVVVVTNQTVIARGLASERDVELIHERIQQLLHASAGVQVDRIYVCPHHPNATLPQYRVDCDCRKPRPGMLFRAAREMDLDLATSYMVGDRVSDIIAGRRAGCTTILVTTGMHTAAPVESVDPEDAGMQPDYVCASLPEAVDLILHHAP